MTGTKSAANRLPDGKSDGLANLPATVADRAYPATVIELAR